MKKLQMMHNSITFYEGCCRYIDDCKQRNLREATINHYKQSYTQFYKFFNPEMPLGDFTQQSYNNYVVYLREQLDNDVSINSYLRDLITTIHFLQSEGYVEPFEMKSIKVDKIPVETYTDDELMLLLKKPNIRKCRFVEYESWVISSFLFSTGVRQRSLINIRVKDIDFDNNLVNIRVTKTRKPLLIPLNYTMTNILNEFLRYRQSKNKDDWLFCNVYGQQLHKSTLYNMMCRYNNSRGVKTTGVHRYRHTFAKQWILNGGNVVTLSRLLGHSSLNTTQNYINLLVSDFSKQVNEIDLLNQFLDKKYIKMKRGKER